MSNDNLQQLQKENARLREENAQLRAALSPEEAEKAGRTEQNAPQAEAAVPSLNDPNLRQKDALYRDLVETSRDLIWAINSESNFTFVNRAAAREIFGYEPEEMLGRPVTAFQPSGVQSIHLGDIALSETETLSLYETTGLRKDGDQRQLLCSAVINRDTKGNLLGIIGTATDITERKRQEDRLRKLFASARCLLWQADIEERNGALIWSGATLFSGEEAALRFLPVAMREGETYLQAWRRARHPEDEDTFLHFSTQEIQAGRSYSGEFRILLHNGEVRWLQEDVYVETLAPGRWRATGVDTDITENKRAQALQAGQNRVLQLIATGGALSDILTILVQTIEAQSSGMLGSVLLLDAEGNHLLLGAAPSLPEHYNNAIHGVAIGPDVGSCGTAAYRGERIIVEDIAADPLWANYRDLALSHGLRACWSQPVFSLHGDLLGTFAMYYRETRGPTESDLNLIEQAAHIAGIAIERTRAEEALRESESRFRTLFESSPLGISLHDPEGQTLQYNRAYAEMLGYSDEELRTKNFTHPEDVAEGRALYRQLQAGERQQYTRQKRYIRSDGQIIWVQITASAIHDQNGALLYILFIAQDISDRRRLEEQLLQAQKMEGIGRLAGGIAHDFNNLLTAISGYTDLAYERLPAGSEAAGFLENVQKASDRAANLTTQLLAFARKQIIVPRIVSLNDVVSNVHNLLVRLIGEHIEIRLRLAPDLWQTNIDPGQFEQILINLVVNSRDAMPTGGTLAIETHNVTLDAEYVRVHPEITPGDYVMLAVSDTGVGMDAAIQQHIFEPFFTTKKTGEGTGLGLAMCHGIVKQSGGHIWVYSEPGKGATFKIYLPRANAAASSLPPAPVSPTPMGTETLLLVEDEPMVRGVAVSALRARGYEVLEAGSGKGALTVAQNYPGSIHLLITDVVMPQMSGRQLAEQILLVRPNIQVLYVSGYTDDTIVQHGVLDDGIAFLQKPYSPTTLAWKVREILDKEKTD